MESIIQKVSRSTKHAKCVLPHQLILAWLIFYSFVRRKDNYDEYNQSPRTDS